MSTYKQEFLICPHCQGQTGNRVDHLFNGKWSGTFGPWACTLCGLWMSGQISRGNEVSVWKADGRASKRMMTLLKRDPSEKPVFFIIEGSTDEANIAKQQEHAEYLYESHSCPSNWIGDTQAVIDDDDTDPHGFPVLGSKLT